MSAKRKRGRTTKKALTTAQSLPLTYAEALEATGKARVTQFMVLDNIQSNLAISAATQTKIMTTVAIMDGIGKLPGDFSKEKFDKPITYHKLPAEAIEWLKKYGFRAQELTPFVTYSYGGLFANKDHCIVDESITEKFFSHLIHCMLTETQIIIARQYYHGLGLYRPRTPNLLDMIEKIPSEFQAEIQAALDTGLLNQIAVDQLHGRIFLEYCVIMMRAQWDKLVSLSCLVFGLKQNWASIFDGLKALDSKISKLEGVHPACKAYLKIFLEIAGQRLAEGSWLRIFRDSLLHGVGQHSLGVIPHKSSSMTTSELWDKVQEEHNWLREGMMAMLIAFAVKSVPENN
jgi:hypothetical protein